MPDKQKSKQPELSGKAHHKPREKEDSGKQPFFPPLPELLQRTTHSPQSLTPAEAARLQRTCYAFIPSK